MKCDFSGYATRANVRCADGRVILRDAFKEQNGKKVPLVWQHQRNDPENVIGHGILENRDDGVYIYGFLNDGPKANRTRALLEHGDIEALSIFANQLTENRKQVSHGIIREVSVVIGGANPGAYIENVTIQHGDDTIVDPEAAVITMEWADIEMEPDFDESLSHADEDDNDNDNSNESDDPRKIFDSLTEPQKKLFYAAVAHALEEGDTDEENNEDAETQHSDDQNEEGDDETMKYNPFEGKSAETKPGRSLTHSDMNTILKDAKTNSRSLKASFNDYVLEHSSEFGVEGSTLEHGITDLDILFPEAKTVTPTPEMIMRQQEWVPKVWNSTRKSPFSRIKSTAADITADDARAKGYIKGKKKMEEQFGMLKRVTTPQTVYKLQKLDRDDIIDITDFDIVPWIKTEMRSMLNEELARAVLVGDGRSVSVEDRIIPDHIRPVYTDDEVYSIHKVVSIDDDSTRTEQADAILDAVYEARIDYRGSGSPTFYAPASVITTMLLARDNIGRRLYNSITELASALRCREVVEVPVMDNLNRTTGADNNPEGYGNSTKYDLLGIMVNLTDYVVGADRGGAVTMFDDFDIDFNKYTYLIETRCSGALVRPKSAIVLEKKHTTP